jgi:transcription-repair coupling factor (superfamily II helicase)
MCKELGIQRLDLADQKLVLTFAKDCRVSPEKITDMVQEDPKQFRLTPDSVLEVAIQSGRSDNPLEATKKVLKDLA